VLVQIFKWPKLSAFLLFLAIIAAPWYFVSRQEQLAAQEASRKEQITTYQQPYIALSAEEMPIIGTLTDSKAFALIIDNSWRNTISPLLVFSLKNNHAHATFFVAGNWASEHPDICRLIAGEGNELGVFGNQYEQYDKQPLEWIKDDIESSAGQIKGVSGRQPSLYCPDNGLINPSVVKAAAAAGYKTVLWSVDANNHINANEDMVIGRLLQSAKPGSIVVIHVPANANNLVSILNTFLKRMEQQSYQVVSVSELLTKYGGKGVVRKSF
jgi:peptidoglycan/xylan/chitin deacetylase (PgdA/CDA1 family)